MKKNTIQIIALHKKLFVSSLLVSSFLLQSCGGDGSPKLKDAQIQTIMESSKGVITEVEEIEPGDDYKIIDEKIIDDKEQSIAVVHRLDGKIDTLSLQKLKSETASSHHSGLRNVLMYSLAASYLSRNLGSTAPNASYYKDANAHTKSTGLKNNLAQTATSRRVSVPGASSTGYGSGKSFRSHGG